MDVKVADMTVDDLKEVIRAVLEEYLADDGELRPEFAEELKRRAESNDLLKADEVW